MLRLLLSLRVVYTVGGYRITPAMCLVFCRGDANGALLIDPCQSYFLEIVAQSLLAYITALSDS